MFGMLQNIRVSTTLVVLGGISFCLSDSCMCCKSCVCMNYTFISSGDSVDTSSGVFVHFFHLCMNSLKMKEKKSLSSGVCVLYL